MFGEIGQSGCKRTCTRPPRRKKWEGKEGLFWRAAELWQKKRLTVLDRTEASPGWDSVAATCPTRDTGTSPAVEPSRWTNPAAHPPACGSCRSSRHCYRGRALSSVPRPALRCDVRLYLKSQSSYRSSLVKASNCHSAVS